jgi:hypothetical protein
MPNYRFQRSAGWGYKRALDWQRNTADRFTIQGLNWTYWGSIPTITDAAFDPISSPNLVNIRMYDDTVDPAYSDSQAIPRYAWYVEPYLISGPADFQHWDGPIVGSSSTTPLGWDKFFWVAHVPYYIQENYPYVEFNAWSTAARITGPADFCVWDYASVAYSPDDGVHAPTFSGSYFSPSPDLADGDFNSGMPQWSFWVDYLLGKASAPPTPTLRGRFVLGLGETMIITAMGGTPSYTEGPPFVTYMPQTLVWFNVPATRPPGTYAGGVSKDINPPKIDRTPL